MKSFICHRCGSGAKYEHGTSLLCESCYTTELGKEFDRIKIKLYKKKCDLELGVIA